MHMKKLAIIGAVALVVIGCVLAAGCTSTTTTEQTTTSGDTSWIPAGMTFNFEPTGTEYEQFYDLGNYLILLKQKDNIDISAALEKIRTTDGSFCGGCSGIAKLNKDGEVIIGRDMDLPLTEYPAFISINDNIGKYKTFSITYPGSFEGKLGCPKYADLIEDGELSEEFYNLIPLLAFDAINEKGLYIESDMRHGDEFLNCYGTNPGKEEADQLSLPTLVAANCATVKEALDFIKNEYSWVSHFANTGDPEADWNLGFIIGDAEGEYGLIEIANDTVNYIPYQPGQTNYYISPFFTTSATIKDGVGRLQILYDNLMEPQTAEEMQKVEEEAYYSKYLLNVYYAYKDENGKVHFVDKDGNPTMDWRGEMVFLTERKLPVDENGKIVASTGYEEGYFAYCIAKNNGDTETMKKYQSDYDKHMEYLNRCTSAAIYDDDNFEAVQAYAILADKLLEKSDKLKKYYAGDEMPLRSDKTGSIWITCLNVGVNCAQKYLTVKFWENDNVQVTYQF